MFFWPDIRFRPKVKNRLLVIHWSKLLLSKICTRLHWLERLGFKLYNPFICKMSWGKWGGKCDLPGDAEFQDKTHLFWQHQSPICISPHKCPKTRVVPNLYIPSAIKTQMNLVYFFREDWASGQYLKISEILLK